MKRLTDFFCPGAKDQRRLAAIIPELRDNILALPFPADYMAQAADRYKEPPEPEDDSLIKLYTDYVVKKLKAAAALEEEAYEDAVNEYGSDCGGIAKIKKNMDIFSAEVSNIMSAADCISDDPSLLFTGKFSVKFDKVTFYSSGSAKDADGKRWIYSSTRLSLTRSRTREMPARRLLKSSAESSPMRISEATI